MFISKILLSLFLILLSHQTVLADSYNSYNNQVYQSPPTNSPQPYTYSQPSQPTQNYDYQQQPLQQPAQTYNPPNNNIQKRDWKFWQKPENDNKLPTFTDQKLKREERKKARVEKQRLKQMKKENELLKEREVLQSRMQQQILSNPANLNQLNQPQSFKAKILNAFKKK